MVEVPTLTKIGVGEVRLSDQAKENVLNVLESSRLSYGPWSQLFEQRWADIHGRNFAIFVNSGTSALQIAIASLKEKYGWQNGNKILVPAMTFVASVNTIIQNGLTPVLVDIELKDYGMDVDALSAAAMQKNVVAVMPVHLFGHVTSVPTFGLKVIADSCETVAMPGCADGDVSCFSTYACHLVQTGVGGLATTNDAKLAAIMRSLANHGRDGIYTSIDQDLGNREVIDARFRFERLGYSYRATELEAAIGCAELDTLDSNLLTRHNNANYIRVMLAEWPVYIPAWTKAAWMMLPIRVQDRVVRDALVSHLEARGIETRPCLPLINQPYMKELFGDDLEQRYPNAATMNETSFYIGCHQFLSNDDLDRIVEGFRSFYGN